MKKVYTIEKDGWLFGVVKILNFSMMDAWEIKAANGDKLEYAGGPYLSEEEAIDDVEAAMERFLNND